MNMRGEWPSGPASSINFTEVKHVCVRSKNWMGDLPDERPKQLTPPSFGRDVKLGVPCLDAACMVGLNYNNNIKFFKVGFLYSFYTTN